MIVIKQILVATDFGEASDAALTYGRALARTFGATLHLLHVVENVFMRAITADPHVGEATAARQLANRLTNDDRERLDARAALKISDSPAETIAAYAREENIDLIVMGTHGRRGMTRWLMGSVAESVVRTASCPVLTVRHPEREFVVTDVANVRMWVSP